MEVASKISHISFEAPFLSNAGKNTSSIVLGQFLSETEALALKDKMKDRCAKNIWIVYENNYYKVVIPGFKNHAQAVDFINQIEGLPINNK
jgi:hypothetical protein